MEGGNAALGSSLAYRSEDIYSQVEHDPSLTGVAGSETAAGGSGTFLRPYMASSNTPSAFFCSSAIVWSEIGWRTNTRAAFSSPRHRAWYSAWARKPSERIATAGSPRCSKLATSCSMHVVQDPQSAREIMTERHDSSICLIISSGQGREKAGLVYRFTSRPGDNCFRSASIRSNKALPPGLLISSRATGPASSPVRGASASVPPGAAPTPRGSCTRPPAAARLRSSMSGVALGSGGRTTHDTGTDMWADGMGGVPMPKPGQKLENFPASPPVTTMWKEPSEENLGMAESPAPVTRFAARAAKPSGYPTRAPGTSPNFFCIVVRSDGAMSALHLFQSTRRRASLDVMPPRTRHS
mmetsp:Transcript_27360/g.76406  ORF Transcript_27360/g.76406 Transcript_27360/m.76406 type:complete len:354 (-) Transcript_27360:241-1302(-)